LFKQSLIPLVFGGDNFDDDENFENIIRENSSAALDICIYLDI